MSGRLAHSLAQGWADPLKPTSVWRRTTTVEVVQIAPAWALSRVLGSVDHRSPVGPVEVRPAEPPHAERQEDDQRRDFQHGNHVETPSPEAVHPTRDSAFARATYGRRRTRETHAHPLTWTTSRSAHAADRGRICR